MSIYEGEEKYQKLAQEKNIFLFCCKIEAVCLKGCTGYSWDNRERQNYLHLCHNISLEMFSTKMSKAFVIVIWRVLVYTLLLITNIWNLFKARYLIQMVSLYTGVITYGNDQKFYYVVAVNLFTCWIEVRVLTHETLEKVIQFIKDSIFFLTWMSGQDPNRWWKALCFKCDL